MRGKGVRRKVRFQRRGAEKKTRVTPTHQFIFLRETPRPSRQLRVSQFDPSPSALRARLGVAAAAGPAAAFAGRDGFADEAHGEVHVLQRDVFTDAGDEVPGH